MSTIDIYSIRCYRGGNDTTEIHVSWFGRTAGGHVVRRRIVSTTMPTRRADTPRTVLLRALEALTEQ